MATNPLNPNGGKPNPIRLGSDRAISDELKEILSANTSDEVIDALRDWDSQQLESTRDSLGERENLDDV